jgi:hypothetical protein
MDHRQNLNPKDTASLYRSTHILAACVIVMCLSMLITTIRVWNHQVAPEPKEEEGRVYCGNAVLESNAYRRAHLTIGDPIKGKELFNNNCSSCHSIHKRMVGPALKGILERRKLPWIVRWVKSPLEVVVSKDRYATKLVKEYEGIMPGFPLLKEQEIKDIISYLSGY